MNTDLQKEIDNYLGYASKIVKKTSLNENDSSEKSQSCETMLNKLQLNISSLEEKLQKLKTLIDSNNLEVIPDTVIGFSELFNHLSKEFILIGKKLRYLSK